MGVLLLLQGVLHDTGTHQELLARRGIYHRLFQLQFQPPVALTVPS